jgi:hypothetical protein
MDRGVRGIDISPNRRPAAEEHRQQGQPFLMIPRHPPHPLVQQAVGQTA